MMNELDASAAEAQADLDRLTGSPQTVIWKGQTIPAMIGNMQDHLVLEAAGDRETAAFVVIIRKGALANGTPAQRDSFTIDGNNFVILELRTSDDDPDIEFMMVAEP